MNIKKQTHDEIKKYYVSTIPERGGIIGGTNDTVSVFVPDKSIFIENANQYVPNIKYLNDVLCDWNKNNINFLGIIHSHPNFQKELSSDDKKYIYNILECMPNTVKKLYFPIVISSNEIIPYKAKVENSTIKKTKLTIVN